MVNKVTTLCPSFTTLFLFHHTGESIAEVIVSFLAQHNIDLAYCRGRSYDYVSNMSGRYRGVQAADFNKSHRNNTHLQRMDITDWFRLATNQQSSIQEIYTRTHTLAFYYIG